MHALRTCTHTRAQAGLDNVYCPDCKRNFKPKSKEYQEILAKPCTAYSVSSQELDLCANLELEKQDSGIILELPSSSKQTLTDSKFSSVTTPTPPSTQISEHTAQISDQTCLLVDFPVEDLAQQEQEKDCLIHTLTYGLRCCELLMNPARLLWLLKTWQVLLIEGFEQCLEDSEWLATSGKIRKSYQQRNSVRPTCENECLLLPTPVAYSRASNEYRPPGGDKLETALKLLPTPTATDVKGKRFSKSRQGGMDLETALEPLIPKNHVSHPQVREYMMGIETGYTAIAEEGGGTEILHQQLSALPLEPSLIDMNESPPLETPVLLSKPQLSGLESPALPDALTYDEERDLAHLERKVERAFYEAGRALEEIRDRKLYRVTHKTFESYCKDRFGYSRRKADYAIAASLVVDNLEMRTNGSQNEMSTNDGQNKMRTNCSQILPTNECQVRNLINLEPDEQRQVWQEAVEKSNGKVPSGAVVKGIVERLKEKTFVPLTQRSELSVGDVVKVKPIGSTLRYCDGYWGILERIGENFYHVCISVKNEVIQCKGDEVKRVATNEQDRANFKLISDRILALVMLDDLATTALAMLEALSRKTSFTDDDLWFLEIIEERYGINK